MLAEQAGPGTPEWETLVRAPLPEDVDPLISVNGLTMPAQPVAAHSHAGPVIGYILEGEIENQVEPDLFLDPADRAGLTFSNASSSELAKLLLYHVTSR
jgi:hypothetical protein